MTQVLLAFAVLLSSHAAHARNVRMTLTFHYDMQCGYPGPQPLVLQLPEQVPASLPRAAVLLDGKPAPAVQVKGRRVAVLMPPRPIVMCDSIGPGTLTVAFTRAAHLTNPAAGRYRLTAVKGLSSYSARVRIR